MALLWPFQNRTSNVSAKRSLYRLQVRDEQRQATEAANRWKAVVFWAVMFGAAILLFALMRRS
jgi:hypothetical protein